MAERLCVCLSGLERTLPRIRAVVHNQYNRGETC